MRYAQTVWGVERWFSFFCPRRTCSKTSSYPPKNPMCACENGLICFPSSANWVIINSGQEHNCLKKFKTFLEMKDCISFAKLCFLFSFFKPSVWAAISATSCNMLSHILCVYSEKRHMLDQIQRTKNSSDTCFIMLRSSLCTCFYVSNGQRFCCIV